MKKDVEKTEAGLRYATAYETHYKSKDLHKAIKLYKSVMDVHPDTEEAKYSRSQIQNIVQTVVPKQELFEAQVKRALDRLGLPKKPDTRPALS